MRESGLLCVQSEWKEMLIPMHNDCINIQVAALLKAHALLEMIGLQCSYCI